MTNTLKHYELLYKMEIGKISLVLNNILERLEDYVSIDNVIDYVGENIMYSNSSYKVEKNARFI